MNIGKAKVASNNKLVKQLIMDKHETLERVYIDIHTFKLNGQCKPSKK